MDMDEIEAETDDPPFPPTAPPPPAPPASGASVVSHETVSAMSANKAINRRMYMVSRLYDLDLHRCDVDAIYIFEGAREITEVFGSLLRSVDVICL